MLKKSLVLLTVLLGLASAAPLWAGGGFGGGFGGGRMTTADRVRQQIGFTDDEWTVIQPKLQRILDAQSILNATANQRGGYGGGFGAAAAGQQDPVFIARQELAQALQDQNAAPDVLTAKMKALRDARLRAKDDLAKAQDDLIRVLTIRQEALLLGMGILE